MLCQDGWDLIQHLGKIKAWIPYWNIFHIPYCNLRLTDWNFRSTSDSPPPKKNGKKTQQKRTQGLNRTNSLALSYILVLCSWWCHIVLKYTCCPFWRVTGRTLILLLFSDCDWNPISCEALNVVFQCCSRSRCRSGDVVQIRSSHQWCLCPHHVSDFTF